MILDPSLRKDGRHVAVAVLSLPEATFDAILDEVLDGRGENIEKKEFAKFVEELCLEHNSFAIL